MSLTQSYRSQIATLRNRWLWFYLALAATVHVVGVIGLAIWHPGFLQKLQAKSSQDKQPTPVEFVYVEPQTATVAPPKTNRLAQANSTATNRSKPNLSTQTGKTPTKTVPLQSAPKPVAPTTSTRPPISAPLQTRAAQNPTQNPVRPSSTPSISQSSTAQASPTLRQPSPTAAPTPLETVPASPVPAQLSTQPNLDTYSIDLEGQGLNGSLNPEQTGTGSSVDAVQDDLWGTYLAALNRAIDQQWQRVSVAATRRTRIQFRVDRQGRLTELRLLQSSGDTVADQAALQAIRAAAPFAPLPQDASEEALVVNFTFTQWLSPEP